MIERYTTPELGRIWSDENKFKTWLLVEIAVTEVLTEMGEIPEEALQVIKEKADFSIDRILEIEEETHHDVIAFLTNLAENIGPESRFIHMGMTSSDLLDTSLALLCKEAGEVILEKLKEFKKVLRTQAVKYRETLQIGRSHGVHAEPITFGLKLALWSEEISRHIDRWDVAVNSISTGKISGAVGTYQHLDPIVEEKVCEKLGIQCASVSSQVVQRDHHAEYLNALALIGASLEKIAVEIRHLQRTEVLEVEEPFAKGQKGSSAMPHKRNPIITERVTGMARLLRGNAMVGLENVALWHERDISHSSAERITLPDSSLALDYILDLFAGIIQGLRVYPERMWQNMESTRGLVFSQRVLLSLIDKGLSREKAYELVQRNSMRVWDEGLDLRELVSQDAEIKVYLSQEELMELFNYDYYLRYVNDAFRRVGLL